MKSNILIIIPVRGGSKGIPRKNIRPLNGKPLVMYSINTAKNSKYKPDIYISSDDDEILNISSSFNVKTYKRSNESSTDTSTLDPVIHESTIAIEKLENKKYDIVITMQATSPLLKTKSLDLAIEKYLEKDLDTIISAIEDTHLTWKIENNQFIKNYKERLNRQYLPPIYKETGGFLITKRSQITKTNRIGNKIDLYLLPEEEAIDIDTYTDWSICEYYLKRKRILFVTRGNKEIGMGHVYNTLSIANELTEHEVTFLVDNNSELAYKKIQSLNYPVLMQKDSNIINEIKRIKPNIIINDILESEKEYMSQLKDLGVKIINFEDSSENSKYADLVINAIFSEKRIIPKHYYGHKYFILRDEFYSKNITISTKQNVKNILITFGGTDPSNHTLKILSSIYNYCMDRNITINVIAGIGYENYDSLTKFKNIQVFRNISNISEYMRNADIIFSSSGRTTYEIASVCTPTIVLAQNDREAKHYFPHGENGFINLGVGSNVSEELILNTFSNLEKDYKLREQMSNLMNESDLKEGKRRVLNLIREVISND